MGKKPTADANAADCRKLLRESLEREDIRHTTRERVRKNWKQSTPEGRYGHQAPAGTLWGFEAQVQPQKKCGALGSAP